VTPISRRKRAEWNRKNTDYFKSNYLQKKIDTSSDANSASRHSQVIATKCTRMKHDTIFWIVHLHDISFTPEGANRYPTSNPFTHTGQVWYDVGMRVGPQQFIYISEIR
jgi:hypothetical protein